MWELLRLPRFRGAAYADDHDNRFRHRQVEANKIIRKQSEVFGVEAIVAEFFEEGIMTRFAVFAIDFEPSDCDRLGQLDHFWQTLTVGRDCIGAFFEHGGIGLADIDAVGSKK